ncbi:NupC/NupG family nucleoside CNT transporter [Desulfospira joergensenii]|uniref:NupC/NupG family nucleoside CNT transporter n=1 Tax=Desulfospira joergensenii TaxID=53329 RepID=UPI0003B74EFE|nr:nucleoside transporter C-terminal domain-containing protein [Desulfospira joergensenii]
MDIYNLVSFSGIFILLFILWAVSRFVFGNTTPLNWQVVVWGLAIQLSFAAFLFLVPAGVTLFQGVNDFAVKILETASHGTLFVFGPLALPPGEKGSLGFILAFQGFPTIIFFSALVAVLYYYPVLPFVIRLFARLFTRLMKVSGAEALCTAGNIFVGVESALVVKPHLEKMTRSELGTVLTAGMSTVASNVLALYVFTLRQEFPSIAGHLISASFLSAPAALVTAKILMPETGIPATLGKNVDIHYEKEANLFEAVINGASTGLKVIFSIVALLIAVLGLVALADLFLGMIGDVLGQWTGAEINLSLKQILGALFYPLTLIIGVPFEDAGIISGIIGERIVLTEVASYKDLALVLAENRLIHPRSAVVTAYALCGFAHVASMAIFVGGVSALTPKRTTDISSVAVKALIAATFSCLLTACVAGAFFNETSLLLGKL